MPADPTEIDILEAALAESPDNVTLRLHVAGLHLGVEGPGASAHGQAALAHAQHVMAGQPDHLPAIRLAAAAATAVGQDDLAARYSRLAAALGSSAAGPSAPPAPPTPADLPGPAPVTWTSDGSHDDLAGETPLYVSFDELAGPAPTEPDVDAATSLYGIDVPDVRLRDVGGLDDVKERLRISFLAPLQNPELRAMYRTSLRGGMLLYGPPGCGKTFIARALAGELQARFLAIGLHEVLDMWLGASERNLHQLFETARRQAPCVLFLDEVDALGHKRSGFHGASGGRNVVVQLLDEMDGVRDDNDGLFVIGATNQPWDIDGALRRPGRFDRMVLVLPPDEPAREAILRYHLRDRPVEADLDLSRIVARTELFSGADLRLLCDAAAEAAMDDSMRTGQVRPIRARDLQRALRDITPSTRGWFETARNFAQFANEGGRYDDLLAYLRAKRI